MYLAIFPNNIPFSKSKVTFLVNSNLSSESLIASFYDIN